MKINPKIVCIGGGTGLPILLSALKQHYTDINAIVTTMDNGGSTGRIREQNNIIAIGDIRNCLLSLSNVEIERKEILQYRFVDSGVELDGHNAGNLYILATYKYYKSMQKTIEILSKIFNITGKIIPVTYDNVNLSAIYKLGDNPIIGEKNIAEDKRMLFLDLVPINSKANPEAIKAVQEADYIIFSCGSLYTSIIANLLFTDLCDVIKNSTAKKIYIANLICHTKGDFKEISDYIQELCRFLYDDIDICIANNNFIVNDIDSILYEEKEFVKIDNSDNVEVIKEDLLHEENYIRHDINKLSKILKQTIDRG